MKKINILKINRFKTFKLNFALIIVLIVLFISGCRITDPKPTSTVSSGISGPQVEVQYPEANNLVGQNTSSGNVMIYPDGTGNIPNGSITQPQPDASTPILTPTEAPPVNTDSTIQNTLYNRDQNINDTTDNTTQGIPVSATFPENKDINVPLENPDNIVIVNSINEKPEMIPVDKSSNAPPLQDNQDNSKTLNNPENFDNTGSQQFNTDGMNDISNKAPSNELNIVDSSQGEKIADSQTVSLQNQLQNNELIDQPSPSPLEHSEENNNEDLEPMSETKDNLTTENQFNQTIHSERYTADFIPVRPRFVAKTVSKSTPVSSLSPQKVRLSSYTTAVPSIPVPFSLPNSNGQYDPYSSRTDQTSVRTTVIP